MVSFKVHNLAAILVGGTAGIISNYFLPELDWLTLAAIIFSGYLGGHLPAIQNPSCESYQVIRASSAVAAFVTPIAVYFYRPTDIVLGWFAAYLLFHGAWWLLDRISLYRDYTRYMIAIVILPLLVGVIGYLTFGANTVVPIFLATSIGYIVHLLLEQYRLIHINKSLS